MDDVMKSLKSKEYPLGHILNPDTTYTPAARTDVRKTIERARKRMEAEKKQPVNVLKLKVKA